MGTTQRMAGFITQAKFEDIPAPAVNLAKLCMLDAVGCALYGSTRPIGKIMAGFIDEMGGKPVARVIGSGMETNAVNAAMANATFTHSDDFDDWSAGHQACLLMPVVFALGEELHASGKHALLSYITGFDISVHTHYAMGDDHYGKGWHNTSSVGTLGSTAAAAKMLGLDEMQTRMAIGLGATQAAGLRAQFGTMGKPFNPGNACRAGVTSAKLAQKGFQGNPDAMEHRFGYAAVYGEEMLSLPSMTRRLGNPWALMGAGREVATGISIKIWPCCGGTHAPNSMIMALLKKNSIKAQDVASIDFLTTRDPAVMAPNIRWPKTGLEGKFSPWYTVASMILDGGKLDVSSFSEEAVKRPAVQELLKKVTITQDSDFAGRPHRARGGEEWWDMTVTLKNGEQIVAPRLHHTDTWGWKNKDAVFDKFKTLAGSVLKPAQADAALNAIMNIEEAADVKKVVDTFIPAR